MIKNIFRVKLHQSVPPQLVINQRLLILMRIQLTSNSNHQKMTVVLQSTSTSLSNEIPKPASGPQSKLFPLIRKTMQRQRRKNARRRRLRQRLMVSKKEILFNSEFVLRIREVLESHRMLLTCTKSDLKR